MSNAVARKVRDAIAAAALVGFDSLDQIRGLLHEAATEIERLQVTCEKMNEEVCQTLNEFLGKET